MNFRSRELHLQRHQVIPHHKVVVPLEPPIEPPVGKDCGWRFVRLPWNARVDGKPFYSFMSFITSWMKRGGQTINLYVTGWVSSCSVITVPKEVGLHTTAPTNNVLNPVSFPPPVPPVPPPPVFPPVGATYRYGYMDGGISGGISELNPLNSYNEVLPPVIQTQYDAFFNQGVILEGQWLYEQDSTIAVAYGGNAFVYSLSFISPPLLANTWPFADANSTFSGRLGFYDPNSNCVCAVYSSLSTPTGSNYGTINVNTGATTTTFYALPNTTNNGVSLIFAQASERCSPTSTYFVTISSMFWNGGAVSTWRVCKHSKATGALLGDSGTNPITDDWKVSAATSIAYVADREEIIVVGNSAPFPAPLGFNVFNSSLALIQSIPDVGGLDVLAGSRNGGASIFFTQANVLGVCTLTRYAHNGVAYVATATLVLPQVAASADWSSTMNVLWVSFLGVETRLYHGTTLALLDTTVGASGTNTLAPD